MCSAAYLLAVGGWEVWGARERWLFTHAVCALFVGLLPLVCASPRQFVARLSWVLPLYFLQGAAELAFEWAVTTKDGFAFCWWTPLFLLLTVRLNFRRRFFLLEFLGVVFVGYCARLPLKCVGYNLRPKPSTLKA